MTVPGDTARRRHKRALAGWLGYAFASEVFVIVSLTLYLPICLEQFARDNGYLLPERTTPCIEASAESTARCVVKFGWAWLDTASFRYSDLHCCMGCHTGLIYMYTAVSMFLHCQSPYRR